MARAHGVRTERSENGGVGWNNSMFCIEQINYAVRIGFFLIKSNHLHFATNLNFLDVNPLEGNIKNSYTKYVHKKGRH